MAQFSDDGTPVEVELLSGHLLLIDPLYLQEIRDEYEETDPKTLEGAPVDFVRALETKFFPWGGDTLLGYLEADRSAPVFQFAVSRLRYHDHSDEGLAKLLEAKELPGFSTDFGAFLLLDLDNFFMLLQLVDVEDLIDASEGNFQEYAAKINLALGNKGWAYIQNPGIGRGCEFEGSGSYFLNP